MPRSGGRLGTIPVPGAGPSDGGGVGRNERTWDEPGAPARATQAGTVVVTNHNFGQGRRSDVAARATG